MKTTLRFVMAVAVAAAASTTALAQPTFINFPDGGTSALLVGMGAVGLVAVRGVFRKK